MSAKVKVTVDPAGRQFVVDVGDEVANRRGLNAVLADRLADELVEYLRRDNARKPNNMGAPRTNFYNRVADATAVASVSETGATVAIAEPRFRVHVFGGTIKPVKAKMLTIPLVKEARGLRASSYARKFGRRLFTLPGINLLFEKVEDGAQSLVNETSGRTRDEAGARQGVTLAARSRIRPVYALAKSAKIEKDPTALPKDEVLASMLAEEARDFVERQLRQPGGGPA
jgi:hypothetical protein